MYVDVKTGLSVSEIFTLILRKEPSEALLVGSGQISWEGLELELQGRLQVTDPRLRITLRAEHGAQGLDAWVNKIRCSVKSPK